MQIAFQRSFLKQFKKLPQKIQEQFRNRRDLFLANPFHPILDNHYLHGEYKGYRSINITGDYRAIYEPVGPDTAFFIKIGTHTELYG
jgi:addiction module RelE/StbE family toxin